MQRRGSGTSAALLGDPRVGSFAGPIDLLQNSLSLTQFVISRYRWLLVTIPVYALLVRGVSSWPMAVALSMAAILYNTILPIAERRWPEWVASRALYLRCIEIGLACIGLSVIYLGEGSVGSYRFYYDGFYAVFVALAAVSKGRSGALWSAGAATLAVGIGQVMLIPSEQAALSAAGLDYLIAISAYSGLFGLFFLAIGLLADFATAFSSQLHLARGLQQFEGQFKVEQNRTLEIAAQRERLARTGEVTAQIMHELSTPLTGIACMAEYLREVLDEREQDSIELIRSEVERAAEMVRDVLRFTRRETDSPAVSLNDVVKKALRLNALMAAPDQVEVVSELDREPAYVSGGSTRLEQLVLNLVENAQHAVAELGSGRVTVRTRVEDAEVSLEVSDTGPGIPREVQRRIFEPFFTTKEPGVGTGLGLSIVQRIVREREGHISVSSAPGRGTTFTARFQKVAPPPQAEG